MSNGPFGNCKSAELHKTLQVQGYGGFLAIDKRSQQIVACSENIEEFLGKAPQMLLGLPWAGTIPPAMLESMFISGEDQDATAAITGEHQLGEQRLIVANHTYDDICYVEFEPLTGKASGFAFNKKTQYLSKLAATASPEESARLLMGYVATLIGFDRIMLYKFLPQWHGEVIDEKNKPGVEGFLGLRFPASDLPANARRMFSVNLQRLIADTEQDNNDILLLNDEVELDMTFTQLRAVHPVHIKYLENIGALASFSLSLVVNGKLWGLIACHHLSPKVLSLPLRQQCEELTRITALHMTSTMLANLEQRRYRYREQISELRGALSLAESGLVGLVDKIEDLKAMFNADGCWLYLKDHDHFWGNVPDTTSLSLLKNWLARFDTLEVSVTFEVPEEFANVPSIVRHASGMLFIPLNKKDFILLMRQEQIEKVEWAGKPSASSEEDTSAIALTPRSSFQKWAQEERGKCNPWHELDLESAQLVRNELLEFFERSQIEAMAMRDPLTGVGNRLMFERQMETNIRKSITEDAVFAVFMLDLDKFKPVNDTFGHGVGDQVLIQVTERLRTLLRDQDLIARLGGDEFGVILTGVREQKGVEDIAERMVQEIRLPFMIDGTRIEIGASIGVSICPLDSSSTSELVKGADIALYEAKKEGRNSFQRFNREMLTDQDMANRSGERLKEAFEKDEFELRYQPVLSTAGKLQGFEAFSVWKHPEQGILPAREFAQLMEIHQYSGEWLNWGLRALFSCYQDWMRKGLKAVPLGLNLNARQFVHMDVGGLCARLSDEFQVGMSWLRFDLDEQALIVNPQRTEEKINALRQQGVLVNIDHFGQGLVSLKQLAEIKINGLKINAQALQLTTAGLNPQIEIIRSISNVLGVPMMATQVETDEQLALVKKAQVEIYQGHLTGEPMSADDATDFIRNRE